MSPRLCSKTWGTEGRGGGGGGFRQGLGARELGAKTAVWLADPTSPNEMLYLGHTHTERPAPTPTNVSLVSCTSPPSYWMPNKGTGGRRERERERGIPGNITVQYCTPLFSISPPPLPLLLFVPCCNIFSSEAFPLVSTRRPLSFHSEP